MREHGKWETEHTVSAHLQHDTGQQHRTAGRCLNVRIGQPGVEGYGGQLHEEPDHQHDEQNLLQTLTEEPGTTSICGLCVKGQGWDVKRATGPSAGVGEVLRLEEVHGDQTQQHDDRGGEGVDEELLRSILSVVATPFEDEEEHRNQGQLPEHVEHEQVERHEDTDERTTHHQDQREIDGCVLLVPRGDDGHGQQEGGEPHHGEGQGVHAHAPVNAEGFNPNIAELVVETSKGKRSPIQRPFDVLGSEEHGRGKRQHQQREDKGGHSNRRAHSLTGSWRGIRHERQNGDAADKGQSDKRQRDPIGRQATTPQISAKRPRVPNAAIKM